MNFLEALNDINRQGTATFDNLIGAGNNLIKGVKFPSKSGMRKAAEQLVQTTQNEGLIYVPAPTPEIRTGLGFVKSVAGPLGMPFRIGNNDKSRKFYQDTINVATKTSDGKVIFNQNIKDKDAYNSLGKKISNKDVGRYLGTVDDQGNVIVEDDYNTNNSIPWHLRRVFTGENAQGDSRPVDASGRVISAASAFHKGLDNMGWTNDRPYGTKQNLGIVQQ